MHHLAVMCIIVHPSDERFIKVAKGDNDHADVIKRKHFPRYWSFLRGIRHVVADVTCEAMSNTCVWLIPCWRIEAVMSIE